MRSSLAFALPVASNAGANRANQSGWKSESNRFPLVPATMQLRTVRAGTISGWITCCHQSGEWIARDRLAYNSGIHRRLAKSIVRGESSDQTAPL